MCSRGTLQLDNFKQKSLIVSDMVVSFADCTSEEVMGQINMSWANIQLQTQLLYTALEIKEEEISLSEKQLSYIHSSYTLHLRLKKRKYCCQKSSSRNTAPSCLYAQAGSKKQHGLGQSLTYVKQAQASATQEHVTCCVTLRIL